jgi:hypothetical protein
MPSALSSRVDAVGGRISKIIEAIAARRQYSFAHGNRLVLRFEL